MNKSSSKLLFIFTVFLITRLIAMIYFPLQDTTEARYGEIARIMAETGDWITPYFDYNVPFWGKPPLVFWLEALSIKLFGFNDFAPRFPSWLLTIATAGLIYKLLVELKNREAALWGIVIYLSTGLVFILAGVVILDPVFTFATTLAYVSFVMVLNQKQQYWSYLFFIAIALGLLSKGPLVIVLVGGTIGLWLLFSLKRWRVFKLYPWVSGLLLMSIIVIPWYVMAELKTPGFLNYFIVGEHFQRFVDAGWKGDLYGVAHKRPHGIIWIDWLTVSLPWGLIAIGLFIKSMWIRPSIQSIKLAIEDETFSFYFIWALFPMLFFTLSGNVLSTYVLPGLPALAIILAIQFTKNPFFSNDKIRNYFTYSTLILPLVLMIVLVYTNQNREIVRTQKYLMADYKVMAKEDQPLFYFIKKPFSARFYSQGQVKSLSYEEFEKLQSSHSLPSYYLAVSKDYMSRFKKVYPYPVNILYSSRLYNLIKIENND